jgi:uncharacterized protein YqhQ
MVMEAKDLIGGMALPQGVMFVSKHRVSVAYHDAQGLQHYTREIHPRWLRAGPLGSMGLLLLEGGRAIGHIYRDSSDFKGMVVASLIGAPLGLLARAIITAPEWQRLLFALVALGGMFWAFYRFHLPFRQGVLNLGRYHGAEHMVAHTVEKGLPLTLEQARQQPRLHRSCGTNLAVLTLPLIPISVLLPFWAYMLLLLPLLPLFSWTARNADQNPLASRLLQFGYWGQRYTVAQPEERHLEAALRAMEGLQDQPERIGLMA